MVRKNITFPKRMRPDASDAGAMRAEVRVRLDLMQVDVAVLCGCSQARIVEFESIRAPLIGDIRVPRCVLYDLMLGLIDRASLFDADQFPDGWLENSASP